MSRDGARDLNTTLAEYLEQATHAVAIDVDGPGAQCTAGSRGTLYIEAQDATVVGVGREVDGNSLCRPESNRVSVLGSR